MTNLRQLARGQDCRVRLSCCNFDPTTTILAHIRRNNPGIGRKPSDWIAVHCCSACHRAIDQVTNEYTREEIDSALLYALCRQLQWYVSKEILP
jgi:Protein of unknown function (DUF1364)